MIKKRFIVHRTGCAELNSHSQAGNKSKVPNKKVMNKKFKVEMEAGFFLTSTLYTAKQNAAVKIIKSPVEKRKDNKLLRLADVNNTRIPVMQMHNPTIRTVVIFSLRK